MKRKDHRIKDITRRHTAAAIFSILTVTAVMTGSEAGAEEFGVFTTATISSEGEGGIFTSVGKDQFGTGIMSRFLINGKSDIGIKIGFIRSSGINSAGIGSDLKYYLIGEGSAMPVDIAGDISLAHYRSEDFDHTTAGFALLVSGVLTADTEVPVEPYGSIGIYTSFLHNGDLCEGSDPSCTDDDTDTDIVFNGGAKVIISDDYQILLEVRIDGSTTFGGAINIIF